MNVILLVVLIAQATVSSNGDWKRKFDAEFDAMEKAIVHLQPSAFPHLPAAIQKDLVSRRCTIPQTQAGSVSKPHNVIKGRFQIAGRTDWAVLCSVDGISWILIYKGSTAHDVYEMPNSKGPDRNWLQGGLGYSREIHTVDADVINSYKEEFEGPEPPLIDHDGLADVFVEKGSTIYYWHEGSWLEISGGD